MKKAGSVHPRNALNELAGNEWLFFTKSVLQTSYPSAYGHHLRKQHGANKPPQLMKHIIEFFTKPGQTVLDPFCGVGGTLVGASLCRRIATGIDINERWLAIYEQVCREENLLAQEVIHGDCLEVMAQMAEQGRAFDFVVTDPPYSIALEKTMCDGTYDIQHRRTDFDSFSDHPRDLRNLPSFAQFYDAVERSAQAVRTLLRPESYFVVILRDSYQNGEYIMASYEISERIKRAGFVMKGIKIWYGTGSRVRPYGYPYTYVPNIVHQNILIFKAR
ncbi:MAG: site-specific DNA-methyltransferase [Chloroflexi bacterium]|nr:site-specific DNA-methyltransferase [Chloroflexota bacterium]MDA8189568.1 DNA methyltransferase [Dehalococcoidales bacterium]